MRSISIMSSLIAAGRRKAFIWTSLCLRKLSAVIWAVILAVILAGLMTNRWTKPLMKRWVTLRLKRMCNDCGVETIQAWLRDFSGGAGCISGHEHIALGGSAAPLDCPSS